MKISFAFNKAQSPVSRLTSANVKHHPQTQYMGLCKFDNVYWEFDREHNNKPRLVFEGNIERLDAINKKFPQNIDTVYFNRGMPRVRYDYDMDEQQLSALALTGFWSKDGVRTPELFTSSKFQLELDATVDEITKAYDKQDVPILNVNIEHPYDNTFTKNEYENLETLFVRNTPEESKAFESKTYQDYVPSTDIQAEVEAAKALAAEQAVRMTQAEYVPLSAEELMLRRQSSNVSDFVDARRERLYGEREANNAAYVAEQERIAAENEAKAKLATESVVTDTAAVNADKSSVQNTKTHVETNTVVENNADIFNSAETDDDTEMSNETLAFMSKLGATVNDKSDTIATDVEKKKRDDNNGSGNASGAQTSGTYTFEDESTAQFAERMDVGVGNEKPSDEDEHSDETDAYKDNSDTEEARRRREEKRRKAAALSAGSNISTPAPVVDDKSDRSK